MKIFIALNIIPKPNPPNNPVINLSLLLLSRNLNNCVVPSIAAGIKRIIEKMINFML